MEVVCPALPALETLPFAHDRDAAWHMLLAPGKVAVSDAGVYFLSGADVVEEAARNPELFSSQGAFDLVGSPFPMVPIAFDPPAALCAEILDDMLALHGRTDASNLGDDPCSALLTLSGR